MLTTGSPRARASRRLLIVVAGFCVATAATAAPDVDTPPSLDPVLRLLVDKGLIEAPAAASAASAPRPSPFVDRARDKASDMVLTALNFLGVPYRRGGGDADHGFDCSGFTRHIFERSLGLVLPRRADQQATTAGLLRVARDELRPGDLVFFNTMRRTFSHVGIYLGEGRFIHSPKPGGEVRVDDMHTAYWERRFTGGRRAEAAPAMPATPDTGEARSH